MATLNVSRNGEELSRHLKSYVLPISVFISIEACAGFFGNIAILLVYSKQYKQVNFRYFVLALAFVDLISCCTTLPGEVFSQMNWYDYKYTWICKVKSFFNVFTAWGSASVLLVLAIDRYRKVCHPCKWQIRFDIAFWLCIFCLLISVVMSTPILILWGKHSYLYEFKGENFTVSVCEKSGDYANTIYPLIYICVVSVPIIIMIVVAMSMNFIILCRLFGHQSVKFPSVERHSLKEIDSDKLRSGISEKTETTDDSIGTYKANDVEKPIGNPKGSVCLPTIVLPTVTKENTSNNIVQIQEHSTDIVSTEEDFTNDLEKSRTSFSYKKNTSEKKNNISKRSRRLNYHQMSKFHRKRKTMIMLILTSIFAVTISVYIVLSNLVAKPGGILEQMSDTSLPIFFFFWRLYFVNSVINPVLYGFMDPGFRSGFMHYLKRYKRCVRSAS